MTGIGRSGTSFAAKVLSEAGACLKGDWFNEDIKAGMEFDSMALLNNEIMHGNAGSVDGAISNLGIENIKPLLGSGTFFKDPRFVLTFNEWMESDYEIEHIVYCKRDYREIYESSIKSGHGLAGDLEAGIVILSFSGFVSCFSYIEKSFFQTVKRAGIPVTVLDYPRSVLEFSEIEKLGPLVDVNNLKDAWEKVRNPENIRKPNHEFSSIPNVQDVFNIRISELNQLIAGRDQIIAQKDQAIAQKDRAIVEHEHAISERDQALAQKDQAITEYELAIFARDHAIAGHEHALSERDQAIAVLDNLLKERERKIAEYESKVIFIPGLKKLDRVFRKKFRDPVKGFISNVLSSKRGC